MFVLIFYVLSPLPTFISRRLSDDTDSSSNACRELAYFLTTGIVVSAFGLPVVLARTNTVSCLQDDFSKHCCHPWFLSVCAVSTILVASIFVLDHILCCTLCQLCIVITNRWQWDSSSTVLAQIQWGACGLVMTGNAVIFLTIFGFFVVFGGGDDFSWEQW